MMSVSLDGFFEAPSRELDWHMIDEEVHRHFNEELGAMSAFLDGRVTYELMAEFWPCHRSRQAAVPPDVKIDLRLAETRAFSNGSCSFAIAPLASDRRAHDVSSAGGGRSSGSRSGWFSRSRLWALHWHSPLSWVVSPPSE
jgi:dihydrofolate reductase